MDIEKSNKMKEYLGDLYMHLEKEIGELIPIEELRNKAHKYYGLTGEDFNEVLERLIPYFNLIKINNGKFLQRNKNPDKKQSNKIEEENTEQENLVRKLEDNFGKLIEMQNLQLERMNKRLNEITQILGEFSRNN